MGSVTLDGRMGVWAHLDKEIACGAGKNSYGIP